MSFSSNIYIQQRLQENKCLFHLSWYLTFGKNLKSRKDPRGKGGYKRQQMKKTVGCERVSTMKHKVMDPTKSLKTKLVTKCLPHWLSRNLYPQGMFNLFLRNEMKGSHSPFLYSNVYFWKWNQETCGCHLNSRKLILSKWRMGVLEAPRWTLDFLNIMTYKIIKFLNKSFHILNNVNSCTKYIL